MPHKPWNSNQSHTIFFWAFSLLCNLFCVCTCMCVHVVFVVLSLSVSFLRHALIIFVYCLHARVLVVAVSRLNIVMGLIGLVSCLTWGRKLCKCSINLCIITSSHGWNVMRRLNLTMLKIKTVQLVACVVLCIRCCCWCACFH